jgi:glutamate-ammonia-ligase adenylyltransferase
VENLQFYVDLSQQILNTLGRSSPHGMLYPVDARLRPEGGSAMLALSYDAYDRYLQNRAATWERLALSRTRVVAGDFAFGRSVLDRIERFVVGDGLTEAELDEIVRIRKRMEDGGIRRTPDQLSIKTGSGGIVDIEFIAQALQLRHSGSDPGLRSVNTLESLGRLKEGGYLPPDDAVHLDSAFRLLRTVEKVLRRQDRRARTRLPSDNERLTALARALSYPDRTALEEDLEHSMARTRSIFEAHLARP